MRRGRAFIAVVGALLAVMGAWRWNTQRGLLPPLQVGIWYWKQPFAITQGENARLRQMGVQNVYVRTGTFVRQGDSLHLTLPQQWKTTADGLDITLVFNFGYDIVRNFRDLPNAALAGAILANVAQQRTRAEQAGLHVVGTQLDFDCPTKRLDKYADLLRRLNSLRCAPQSTLSITALPTWFAGGNIEPVMRNVDFTVPQFYEPGIGKTLDSLVPISRLDMLHRGLQRLARTDQPFWVGLPAYGHALMYDEKGDLVSLYHDMTAREAARFTAFRTARTFGADQKGQPAAPATWIGEDILDMVATRPATNGKGVGYHLVYDIPTPQLIARHLDLLREERPANCRGVILFRYPEADSAMTVPLVGLAAALQSKPTQPALQVTLKARRAAWELIDTQSEAERPPIDLTIWVANVGTANTFLAPDAVTLTVCFDMPGIESLETRGVCGVEAYCVEDARRLHAGVVQVEARERSSTSRANVLQFRMPHLAAGEAVRLATLRVSSKAATRVWGRWIARAPGGFTILEGTITELKLAANERK